MDNSVPELGELDLLQTYASRVARRMLLMRFCGEGHPVLAIEEDLIQMAKSRLQEFLLASFDSDRLDLVRPLLSSVVRKVAYSRIMASDADHEVKESLLEELQDMPMEDLLPPVH